jgi:glycyl-tRNA synthetase beta chain
MRWGSGEARFSRPVRWMLALFGADVVPVTFGGVVAPAEPPTDTASSRPVPSRCRPHPSTTSRAGVGSSSTITLERAALVREGIDAAAAEAGAVPVVSEKVFSEVVNLVEHGHRGYRAIR